MSAAGLRVNCGSPESFTDPDGRVWAADTGAVGAGDTAAPPAVGTCQRMGGGVVTRERDLPLLPPEWAGLMRSEAYSVRAYRAGVPPGRYRVRLVLGETHEMLVHFTRRYTLALNGRALDRPVNPFAIAGGFGRPGFLTIDGVEVGDAGLELAFGPDANVYGLEVTPCAVGTPGSVATQALAPQALAPVPADPAARVVRLLFVGNSGTFFWAIPETLQRMVALGGPGVRLEVDSVCHGGKGVDFLLAAPDVRARIAEGPWDFVALQDTSAGPLEHPDLFDAGARGLIDLIRRAGAEPVLYAYNGPLRHTREERLTVQARYDALGAQLAVPVVPCAEALARAIAAQPEWNFHNPDRQHVGMLGGTLAASVWYRAFTGRSAADLPERTTLAGYVTVPRGAADTLAALADAVCAGRGFSNPAGAILARRCAPA